MSESQDYRELLLGCGRSRKKQFNALITHPRSWRAACGPVTLDVSPNVGADLWCDLNQTPPWHVRPQNTLYQDMDSICLDRRVGLEMNFNKVGMGAFQQVWSLESDYWDEIHAYQVLEHLGSQGDAAAFFAHFSELWRILKPNGYLVASVPSRFSDALWGDPSHRRAIVPLSLSFLDQGEYIRQCDGPPSTRSSMSDFRHLYKADFRICETADNRQDFVFVLQAIKPSRWVAPI